MGKLQIAAIIMAIGMAIGAAGAWKVQAVRIGGLKVDLKQVKQEKADCQDANATNAVTIARLQTEIAAAAGLCIKRLAARNDVVARIQRIDAIQVAAPGQPAASEQPIAGPVTEELDESKNGNPPVVGSDPLLAELNRMFPGTANRPD